MSWSKKIKQEARKNRFFGGVILGLVVFLSLSLWSYNPQDPSLNSFGLSAKVTNYCGFIGASLADLFYQFFGLSSWLVVLGGLWLSYKFFTNRFYEPLLNSLLIFGLFLLSFCSLSELHFSNIVFFSDPVHLGGAIGNIIVSTLKPLFHVTGTAVLLWSAFILVFIFYGQNVVTQAFWLLPKKVLIFLMRIGKKIPLAWTFIFSKFKIFYFSLWSKKLADFIKHKLKVIQTFIVKNQRPALVKPQNSPPVNKPMNTGTKPRLVFKESNLTTQQPLLPSSEKELEPKALTSTVKTRSFDFSKLPSLDILSEPPVSSSKINRQDVEALSKKLLDKLGQFSIQGEITAVKTGPALVLFEFKPEDHVKVSRIREMESDLSLALSSESIRIIAPIPGRDVVGIEASMSYREMVSLKNLLRDKTFFKTDLPLVLGRRADNVIGIKDLARIPHLLVAGTTGSGKSMFIISFVTSLLFRHTPDSLRILLIDPKQVDLSFFKEIPHLLSPIITSAEDTTWALNWAIAEMEKRYRSLSIFKARDYKSFNLVTQNISHKDKKWHAEKNTQASPQNSYYFEPLPLICIVIEEFGDLMADRNVKRTIENSVVRLAQKARASGIHLVLAMQSPRKDVLTGLIKTNIPGRISFKVASGTDSRVILDDNGAERLLSHGDMLFLEPGHLKPLRYHGPFVSEKDVTAIGNYWRSQGEPFYEEALMDKKRNQLEQGGSNSVVDIKDDPMYDEILEFIKTCDVVSASYLQRKFRIGYPRAARMIEVLFEEGWIGPPQGSKPREVLRHK